MQRVSRAKLHSKMTPGLYLLYYSSLAFFWHCLRAGLAIFAAYHLATLTPATQPADVHTSQQTHASYYLCLCCFF